ncbi:TetR/AcrR family transcriptional regulator [Streptomyces antarcticus]|uniref:TetR/AcrR family transcriptional regulator n=1 Tax=Streptomyces antarcticus TaxID=2996458 RepID=UPI002271FC84|nr:MULTISPECIES: TetR/AcrR family transcriptional regulator [unclassified Streptomyces]MCY0946881.1 TetR family transcriptional regulator [Streptomyces sp. H34-AA3]MCZ4085619.1 TetR family transcriptional regulator [Streptomyces sp. H34-S5]
MTTVRATKGGTGDAGTGGSAARGRPSLTERRREATRYEIAEAAAALFAERGYEATTVDDIARAAGISLRTFYRYCPTKEDALTPVLTAGVAELVEQLALRPAAEPVTRAVQAAFAASTAGARYAEPGRTVRLIQVMSGVPAIRMRWLAAARAMQDRLAPVLAARTGRPESDLETRLLAAVLIDAVTVALEHWAAGDGREPLTDVSARALALLRLET